MPFAMSSLGAVAVTAIYVIYGAYRDHLRRRLRRDGLLKARLAFMMWNVAHLVGTETGESAHCPIYHPGGYLGDHRYLLL